MDTVPTQVFDAQLGENLHRRTTAASGGARALAS